MTSATATIPALAAVRSYAGKRQTVTVYADGVEIDSAGGARAERAGAAIVIFWGAAYPTCPAGIFGLRADLGAAQAEAHRLVHQTERPVSRGSRQMIQLTTAEWAVAVPVTTLDHSGA